MSRFRTCLLVLLLALGLVGCAPLRAAIPHLFDAAEAAIEAALDAQRAGCGDVPCVRSPTDADRAIVHAEEALQAARDAEAVAEHAATEAQRASEDHADAAALAAMLQREASARARAAKARSELAEAIGRLPGGR